jgi:hypothetical protein
VWSGVAKSAELADARATETETVLKRIKNSRIESRICRMKPRDK